MTEFLVVIFFGFLCFIVGLFAGVRSYAAALDRDCEKMGMFRHGNKVFKCERLEAGDVVQVPGRKKEDSAKNLGGSCYVYKAKQPTWEE